MATSRPGASPSYSGCNFLRQRLLLSTLSSKPVEIKNIRHKEDEPGLKEFEVDLLKLLEKVTNGTVVEISETGTSLLYKPGLLTGGRIEHDCCTQRSIGYYLEALVCLAPFCKKPMDAQLTGVTHHHLDPSVDAIKQATLPVLAKFLRSEGLELHVKARAVAPNGGGRVRFRAPLCRSLRPAKLLNPGKVKRIRGWAFAVRVSPLVASRLVQAAKGVLLKCLPDVYIYTDHAGGGGQNPRSPGFGICLVAETTEGTFFCAEALSRPDGEEGAAPSVPEDVGEEAAYALLREVYRGGCVDSTNQGLAALCMCLCPPDVSKCLVGPLTPYTIQLLRHLHHFLGATFRVDEERRQGDSAEGCSKVRLTCVGVGFANLAKSVS
ncbi:RNA 3'-terminal phosphate cyclase-like protein [Ixodes scapularis]|uniref:RNA 3'-terminal phosphate cyclase-like protein n=1 Tax=Ixodes scapularis TaxID=6945 RepID=UPI001A9EE487|nr:RNA 3'-terminal phosphate cyclase-like protein [Ixodes scapularis]